MRYFEDLSEQAVAEIMNCSVSAVCRHSSATGDATRQPRCYLKRRS
ncbi:hypothetical protein AB0M44_20095 [Streptosporangium subroseum]